MPADPISRWPALLALRPPSFAVGPLRSHGHHLLGPIYRTIRSGGLVRAASRRWAETYAGLAAVHGFGRATSSLAVQPDRWATFHEPQITTGLAHFLNSGRRAERHARIAALFAAAGAGLPDTDPQRIASASAKAEAALDRGRIDLLAKVRHADGRSFCLLIEAKFGHVLGKDQLGGYRAAIAADPDCGAADAARLVVAPAFNDSLRVGLSDHPDWHFMTWAQLLLRLDAALPAEVDDADFRRFRRTIWHRAHA